MNRNEINEQDKWDLTLLFPDVTAWETALKGAEESITAFPPKMD